MGPIVARSSKISGEATSPSFNVKSPSFLMVTLNQHVTKPGLLSPWPNTAVPFEPQPGDHLPRESLIHLFIRR